MNFAEYKELMKVNGKTYVNLTKEEKVEYKKLKDEAESPREVGGKEVEQPHSNAQLLLRGICDQVYKKVLSGNLRRVILNAKDEEVNSNEDIINVLYGITASLNDGNEKKVVKDFIEEVKKLNK